MRLLLIARKSLIEIIREPQLLGLVIVLPVVFVAITAAAYGQSLLGQHPVAVVSTDPAADPLIATIEAQRYRDGSPMLAITHAEDTSAVESSLDGGDIAALMLVEPGLDGTLNVTLRGDMMSMAFHRAASVLECAINNYAEAQSEPPVAVLAERSLAASGPETYFDLYASGLFVFAWLMLIPQTAMLVAREIRWQTLNRLRLTRAHAWDVLGGISLTQLVFALVQVVVVLGSAVAMGFHNRGSWLIASLVGLVIGFSAVGVGLVLACFVEDDSQAANIGAVCSMVQVFFSGSMYALPPLTLFTLADHPIDLFDIFPATHGFLALQQVLVYGASFDVIAFRLGAAFALSALYFGAGVVIFQRLKMREQA